VCTLVFTPVCAEAFGNSATDFITSAVSLTVRYPSCCGEWKYSANKEDPFTEGNKYKYIAIVCKIINRERKGIVSLCSALMRFHLERCTQAWGPQHKKEWSCWSGAVVAESNKGAQRAAAPLLWREAEAVGLVQCGEYSRETWLQPSST